ISWNYIPTLVNLRCKRLTTNVRCPRCGSGEENSLHVFLQCPKSNEVWQNISMTWVTPYRDQNTRTWLTWVFEKGTNEQCKVFCCALWVIWNSRNQMVHERKIVSGRDLVHKIKAYLAEIESVGMEKCTLKTVEVQRHWEARTQDTIHFDAAFDTNRSFCMPTSSKVRLRIGSPISYNLG
ncbi:hypothetical protein Gotur_000650, partial [Gossypium turneri]